MDGYVIFVRGVIYQIGSMCINWPINLLRFKIRLKIRTSFTGKESKKESKKPYNTKQILNYTYKKEQVQVHIQATVQVKSTLKKQRHEFLHPACKSTRIEMWISRIFLMTQWEYTQTTKTSWQQVISRKPMRKKLGGWVMNLTWHFIHTVVGGKAKLQSRKDSWHLATGRMERPCPFQSVGCRFKLCYCAMIDGGSTRHPLGERDEMGSEKSFAAHYSAAWLQSETRWGARREALLVLGWFDLICMSGLWV